MSDTRPKLRLGDRLIELGKITQQHLDVALNEQRRAYRPLGEILSSLGFVRPDDLAAILASDLGLPFVRAHELEPDPLILAAVDREFVHEVGAFPWLLGEDGHLHVAMVQPDDPERVSAVRTRFAHPLSIEVTTPSELAKLMRMHLPEQQGRVRDIFDGLGGLDPSSDAFPVERLTEALLLDGVHRGATDIHIEPEEHVTRLRYRIDGVLTQGENLPRAATDAIISRIKIMSRLDISERRRPQDGRLRLEREDMLIDMRVSVMPCTDGENIVLRILDKSGGVIELAQLGFSPEVQRILWHVGQRPHGLFLVTGPTGSGKTTTLYSMLSQVDAMARNVCTVEDPVEYRMPLLRQSQVDPSIGYDFQKGLRTLLRQDPDVVLVGEIRDAETAEMAIRASMTGHLVFSTLHTNSALGAIPRLVDLGIDAFLIEDALIGVLAQRLVRKVCASCGFACEVDQATRSWLGEDLGTPREGSGCVSCGGSGFQGRSAIAELFLPTDEMAEALRDGAQVSLLQRLAREAGFRDMEHDGKRLVRAGTTTCAEIERVNRSHRLSELERQ